MAIRKPPEGLRTSPSFSSKRHWSQLKLRLALNSAFVSLTALFILSVLLREGPLSPRRWMPYGDPSGGIDSDALPSVRSLSGPDAFASWGGGAKAQRRAARAAPALPTGRNKKLPQAVLVREGLEVADAVEMEGIALLLVEAHAFPREQRQRRREMGEAGDLKPQAEQGSTAARKEDGRHSGAAEDGVQEQQRTCWVDMQLLRMLMAMECQFGASEDGGAHSGLSHLDTGMSGGGAASLPVGAERTQVTRIAADGVGILTQTQAGVVQFISKRIEREPPRASPGAAPSAAAMAVQTPMGRSASLPSSPSLPPATCPTIHVHCNLPPNSSWFHGLPVTLAPPVSHTSAPPSLLQTSPAQRPLSATHKHSSSGAFPGRAQSLIIPSEQAATALVTAQPLPSRAILLAPSFSRRPHADAGNTGSGGDAATAALLATSHSAAPPPPPPWAGQFAYTGVSAPQGFYVFVKGIPRAAWSTNPNCSMQLQCVFGEGARALRLPAIVASQEVVLCPHPRLGVPSRSSGRPGSDAGGGRAREYEGEGSDTDMGRERVYGGQGSGSGAGREWGYHNRNREGEYEGVKVRVRVEQSDGSSVVAYRKNTPLLPAVLRTGGPEGAGGAKPDGVRQELPGGRSEKSGTDRRLRGEVAREQGIPDTGGEGRQLKTSGGGENAVQEEGRKERSGGTGALEAGSAAATTAATADAAAAAAAAANAVSAPRASSKPLHLCACTMVYNEARFLREWVVYHRWMGVQRFFLYDNNSEDDTPEVVARLNAGEGKWQGDWRIGGERASSSRSEAKEGRDGEMGEEREERRRRMRSTGAQRKEGEETRRKKSLRKGTKEDKAAAGGGSTRGGSIPQGQAYRRYLAEVEQTTRGFQVSDTEEGEPYHVMQEADWNVYRGLNGSQVWEERWGGVSLHPWPWVKAQQAGFSHCLLRAQPLCEWVLFADVDEFFVPRWVMGRLTSAAEVAEEVRRHGPLAHALLRAIDAGQLLWAEKGMDGNKSRLIRSDERLAAIARLPVGQVSFPCLNFGPSGWRENPPLGVTSGYICRDRRINRHKSFVRPEAVALHLQSRVHHFRLAEGWRHALLMNRDRPAAFNHYKYQAWSEFRKKFKRRVGTYVRDWEQLEGSTGGRDKPAEVTEASVEPEGWATSHCQMKDDALRSFVQIALRGALV